MAQMYRFTDANGEVRLMAEIDPAPGGSQPAHGALVSYEAGALLVTSGDPIPFDTVQQDTDGYWDALNNQFAIPAGLEGIYVLSIQASVNDPGDGLPSAIVSLSTGIAAPNMYAVGPHVLGGAWNLSGCWVSYFGPGETIAESLSLGAAGSYTLAGSGYCFYSLARIGPVT